MSCKYCKHCQDIKIKEDYEKRKSYVETGRINKYLNGHDIEEAEKWLERIHGVGKWCEYSHDIPISKELFKKWSRKAKTFPSQPIGE